MFLWPKPCLFASLLRDERVDTLLCLYGNYEPGDRLLSCCPAHKKTATCPVPSFTIDTVDISISISLLS